MNRSNPTFDANVVSELINRRKTLKVLGDPSKPIEISQETAQRNQTWVKQAIETSGWAPFHYDRAENGIAEPWRTHVLWHKECQFVASKFREWFTDVKPSNKIPPMLSACGALVLVTWLPQFKRDKNGETDIANEKQISIDEEHLVATGAMVQNLLLVLTAHGMGTYWSSGGQFQTSTMFDKLGIPSNEKLIAAIFVEFPETLDQEKERLTGKHRESRSNKWIREVTIS